MMLALLWPPKISLRSLKASLPHCRKKPVCWLEQTSRLVEYPKQNRDSGDPQDGSPVNAICLQPPQHFVCLFQREFFRVRGERYLFCQLQERLSVLAGIRRDTRQIALLKEILLIVHRRD